MSRSGVWPLIKMSVASWRQDRASSMGGALAYYTLFSIAPVLIIVIAVAGFVFGAEAARGEIVTQLRGLLGDDGAAAVQGLLESASEPAEGLFATLSSIALLLIGATTVFAELQSDLDRIWRAEPTKPEADSGRFFGRGCCRSEWSLRLRFCCWFRSCSVLRWLLSDVGGAGGSRAWRYCSRS